jgi:hypothetical protein
MVSRPRRLESWIYLCVCVYVERIDDKHSNYLWCPNALRNADRNLWLSCFDSEITPRDKMHSTLLHLQHPSATLIQESLMLMGSSTTPSGSKLFSQGKIWDLRWSYLVTAFRTRERFVTCDAEFMATCWSAVIAVDHAWSVEQTRHADAENM